MKNSLVFNELSLPIEKTEELTKNIFNDFIKLLILLREKGINKILSNVSIDELEITPNEYLNNYIMNLPRSPLKILALKVYKDYFTDFKSPLFDDASYEKDRSLLLEYKFEGTNNGLGLGAADIYETLLLSIPNSELWEVNEISLVKEEIVGNDISTSEVKINNIYNNDGLNIYKDFFLAINNQAYELSRINFEKEHKKYFKKIIFCPNVLSQIKTLDKKLFLSALKKLILIETEVREISDYTVSPEGETLSKNPGLRSLREFKLPETDEIVFMTMHLKSLPSSSRMHYLERGNNIYIGYIGPHLDT